MVTSTSMPNLKPVARTPGRTSARASFGSRWFYSAASATVLVLAFVGFHSFYLHGRAYPDRPLAPPVKWLAIAHGLSMTAWILLAALQPVLVASGNRTVHRKLGSVASVLMLAIVFFGVWLTIASTRIAPPERIINGLAPHAFMVVPIAALTAFTALIAIGIWNRHRPSIHKPMMFLATLTASSASLGRIDWANAPFAGNGFEYHLSGFSPMLALGVILLAIKWAIDRRMDRAFAIGLCSVALLCFAATHLSRTPLWEAFAAWSTR
jgi:hypothetical protein